MPETVVLERGGGRGALLDDWLAERHTVDTTSVRDAGGTVPIPSRLPWLAGSSGKFIPGIGELGLLE